jgi:hypothetical protein
MSDEPSGPAHGVAQVVANVVEDATRNAELEAERAREAAEAIAQSAILRQQEERLNAFQAENDRWRESVQAVYEQRLTEATTPLQEAISRMTEALQARTPDPPPPVVVTPPEPLTPPSLDPPSLSSPNGSVGGQEGGPVNPEPTPQRRRGVRLL